MAIKPIIEGGRITYYQEADSNSSNHQFVNINIEDAGGGKFFVIETDRWAFDSIEEFIALLKDTAEKFDYKEKLE